MVIPTRQREMLKINSEESNVITCSNSRGRHPGAIWPVLWRPSWGHMAALGQRAAQAAPLHAKPYGRYKEKSVRDWGFHTSAWQPVV